MPKKSPMYFPTYCMKTIAVALTFIATCTAASTLAVTTTLLPLFPIAPDASAQQQDEGESGEQQQEENDIDLAGLSTTMTGEQTLTNETTAADQQTVNTEIGGLTSADFETTKDEQLNPLQKQIDTVRDELRNGDNIKSLAALNTADSQLFNMIQSLEAQDMEDG